MIAIISDIHGNTEALTAVLADIDSRGIQEIVCLGDIIGYGPQPGACLDTIMERCPQGVMGNHDFATLYEPTRFNLGAESAVFWTRKQLELEADPERIARRWEFLGGRDTRLVLSGEAYGAGELVFVHGSPRRPVNEYIFPDDIYNNPGKVTGAFDRFEHLCFCGHTHVPGVFTDSPDFYSPEDLGGVFEISETKAMINVGSVGQPRDRDPRSCYVIIEPGKLRFARVEYNWQETCQKVYAIDELDDYLGTRLGEGR